MENSSKLSIVGAIIAAGALIAGAILYTNNQPDNSQLAGLNNPQNEKAANQPAPPADTGPIQLTGEDHVLGNPNATLALVVYSDIECPFCRQFHQTMHQIIDGYGKSGQLKWVFRHFPLEMLHPTAKIEAVATECAAELGGNEKFWQYLDELSVNSVPKTDITAELVKIAVKLDLDEAEFSECLKSGKYDQKIAASSQEAIDKGALGTPFSIIIGPSGETQVPGALPYDQLKQTIDQLL